MSNIDKIAEHLKEIHKLSLNDVQVDSFSLGILILYILFMSYISPELEESDEV